MVPSSVFSEQLFRKDSFEGTLQDPAHKERTRARFTLAQRYRTSALLANLDYCSDKNLRHPHWKAVLNNLSSHGIAGGLYIQWKIKIAGACFQLLHLRTRGQQKLLLFALSEA